MDGICLLSECMQTRQHAARWSRGLNLALGPGFKSQTSPGSVDQAGVITPKHLYNHANEAVFLANLQMEEGVQTRRSSSASRPGFSTCNRVQNALVHPNPSLLHLTLVQYLCLYLRVTLLCHFCPYPLLTWLLLQFLGCDRV